MSFAELEALGDRRFQRSTREWRDAVASLRGGPDVADHRLHVGHHRAAQGRHALARQPAGRRRDSFGQAFYGARPDDEILSYLPLCHIAERLISVVDARCGRATS